MRISRDPPSDSRRGDGIVEVVMTCHSGGTLEIYVEPQLPAPALWVAGTTPIVSALALLGAAAGFAVTVVDPIADEEAFPGAQRVMGSTDLTGMDPGSSPYVVVATQGQWDEEALESALRRDVAYIGLVASPTRAAVVRDYLRDQGVAEERIAAIRAPAGMDLGAETPAEVALSILAELVQVRRGRAPFVAAPGPATLPTQAVAGIVGHHALETPRDDIVLLDPVCGMTVDSHDIRHIAEHDGVLYAFCSVGCRARFMKDPAAYAPSASTSAAPNG
jgi:xanthine dehydrogenase accessory factor